MNTDKMYVFGNTSIIVTLILLLSATVFGFTIINNCNAPQDYVNALDSYLQQAYDTYSKEVKTPALCPDFYVELRNDIQYAAVTYSKIGPFGACAYKMEFRCDISRTWLQHLAFHEMTHALQNAIGDGGKGYGWWSEAHAEGLASYYMVVRIYQAGQWQRYGYVQDFWDKQLYRQDPWKCEAPNLCAYQYGAFFAWLAWRYSPLNSTLTYALPMDLLRRAYWNFLLSPWSWGRDPIYNDFDECTGLVDRNSALYCTYSPVLPNRVYVFSSPLLINASGLPDKILLALVTTETSTADVSVTVSYCPECSTETVTTTQTVTETQTVTKTETYTVTYITTTTYTTTVPTTTTVTYTTTVAVPVTTTATETETYTTTVPVTTTVTVPTTTTVTYTTTTTIPTTITSTTTVTNTDVVTKTETATTTVTTTMANQESCTWCWYVVAILAVLVAVCLVRCRNTALNSKKRFNSYGSTVYT
jgi:hypothetical protein